MKKLRIVHLNSVFISDTMTMEVDIVNRILDKNELEQFIKENKIDCYSIIIKIDETTKEASYVIDGEKIIPLKYEDAIKYLN